MSLPSLPPFFLQFVGLLRKAISSSIASIHKGNAMMPRRISDKEEEKNEEAYVGLTAPL
jgi:hypothetical protein